MKRPKLLPDLPPAVTGSAPLIELHGDEYMLIDGCCGVLIYDPCLIKLSLKKTVLTVSGTRLTLQHLTETCAGISGRIATVSFGE